MAIRRLWAGYAAASIAVTAALALSPAGSVAAVAAQGLPLVTVAAIVAGVRLNRPPRTLPWLVLLISAAMGPIGNIIQTVYVVSGPVPYPSPADALWPARYPVQLCGLMLLVGGLSWRRDRAGILDTLIVTCGLGLGVWLQFLRDLLVPAMAWDVRLVSMAYPLGDLLLLAGLIRMVISTAPHNPAFWQLAGGLVVLRLADVAFTWLTTHDVDPARLNPLFVLSSLLTGGAALHPSMAAVRIGEHRPEAHITPLRTALIGSACLLSPVLLIADGLAGPGHPAWLAASVCCIAVFLLVVARMAGPVRTVQDQAGQLESIAYLDGLTGIANRRTGGALVVGILDLDHFKNYNDLFGHPAGDQLLRDAAAAWQGQMRAGDLPARYGGEEFGVILHGRRRDAAVLMDRLRAATPEGQTFSAGLALWTGDESAEQLTARADAALYAAKRDGRDQFHGHRHPGCTDLTADHSTVA